MIVLLNVTIWSRRFLNYFVLRYFSFDYVLFLIQGQRFSHRYLSILSDATINLLLSDHICVLVPGWHLYDDVFGLFIRYRFQDSSCNLLFFVINLLPRKEYDQGLHFGCSAKNPYQQFGQEVAGSGLTVHK